jgi:DNA-binding PadR family transcriptional regulator
MAPKPTGSKKPVLTDDQRKLQPLSPAVFFVLFALADGEKHGYAIMQQTVLLSSGNFRMGPGTLYTTIQRLAELQLIEEILSADETDTRRRYYRLTGAGESLLGAELDRMRDVLETARKMKIALAVTSPTT